MAACGLQPGRKVVQNDNFSSSQILQAIFFEKGSNENSVEYFSGGANARTMAKFAAAMIRELELLVKLLAFEKFDVRQELNFQLRIGSFIV